MGQATYNKIISFIWGIEDDVLCDLFERGGKPFRSSQNSQSNTKAITWLEVSPRGYLGFVIEKHLRRACVPIY